MENHRFCMGNASSNSCFFLHCHASFRGGVPFLVGYVYMWDIEKELKIFTQNHPPVFKARLYRGDMQKFRKTLEI